MKLIAALCNLPMHGCECAVFLSLASAPILHSRSADHDGIFKNELPGFTQHRVEERGFSVSPFPPQPPLLLSHPHPVPPHSPDLSVPSDRLCLDRHISHSSSGKRHVDSGLCPEIKQYAVTGKKKTTTKNDNNKQTNTATHMFTFTCGGPVVTSRQRRQAAANGSHRISMWRASLWNPGTIWALHCWQNTLRDFGTRHLHIRGGKNV